MKILSIETKIARIKWKILIYETIQYNTEGITFDKLDLLNQMDASMTTKISTKETTTDDTMKSDANDVASNDKYLGKLLAEKITEYKKTKMTLKENAT